MNYEVEILPSAQRELNSLPPQIRLRVDRCLQELAINPRPPGTKALKGEYKGCLRIREGDYRIIYRVEDNRLLVIIVRVGNRRDIYRSR